MLALYALGVEGGGPPVGAARARAPHAGAVADRGSRATRTPSCRSSCSRSVGSGCSSRRAGGRARRLARDRGLVIWARSCSCGSTRSRILLAIPAALAVEYLRDGGLEARPRAGAGAAPSTASRSRVGDHHVGGPAAVEPAEPDYLVNLHDELASARARIRRGTRRARSASSSCTGCARHRAPDRAEQDL